MKIRFLALLFGAVLMAVPGSFNNAEAKKMNPCNPCGGKKMNPCNPCGGMSNPCNPCNPCSDDGPKPIRHNKQKNYKRLVKLGERLWKNEKLGTSGNSCDTCHASDDPESLNLEKKSTHSWPHYIGMPDDIVTLDQMINFCMVNPLKAKPLPANSVSMTALAAYYTEYAKKNPASGKNPCNPCGMKKHKRNPCNPCGR